MATLSDAQVYALARGAGLNRSRAIIATAIAHPESGLDTEAHNTNASTGDNSYGLWQINMLGAMGPARRGLFALRSNDDLFDPRTNARVMAGLSAYGLNFLPWTGYKSGEYKAFLSAAQRGADEADAKGINETLKGVGKGRLSGSLAPGVEKQVGEGVGKAASVTDSLRNLDQAVAWLSTPHNWWRIAGVLAGALLIFIAVFSLVQPELASIGKAVGKVPI